MQIRIREGDIHLLKLTTRMPFKYGIATMTRMPMAFVRLVVEVDGRAVPGVAADLLPPKWFTKDPQRDVDEEVREMLAVIQHALAMGIGLDGGSPFEVWHQLYEAQAHWAEQHSVPPLLAHFGTSLVERALIDATCRGAGRPFYRLLAADQLGIELGQVQPSLAKTSPGELLGVSPLRQIIVRHTVGMADPLTDAEIPADARLEDGLPQSLEACIRAYGLIHFKIKVNGNAGADTDRLRRVAAVLDARCPEYAHTLDGNEQFKTLAAFREFWESLNRLPELKPFLSRLLFVEQPLHRSVALQPEVGDALRAWKAAPPVIIDESDATLESLPTALGLGYAGTSHKNCKGVFKGIINRCRLLHRRRTEPDRRWLMSGEDLCNVGPVSLPQDLAVCAALGIESVERNGHHYNAGLSQFPAGIQEQVLRAHGDLYRRSDRGWPTLDIREGRVNLASVNESPFGVRFVTDSSLFTPAGNWNWP